MPQDFVQGSSNAAKRIFMPDSSRDMIVFIVFLCENLSVCMSVVTISGTFLIMFRSFSPLRAVNWHLFHLNEIDNEIYTCAGCDHTASTALQK